MVINMDKENKTYISQLEERVTYIPDNPETPSEMVNKYGTYEIQPTSETDNEFPTIAQELSKNTKKPTVKPIRHSKESKV